MTDHPGLPSPAPPSPSPGHDGGSKQPGATSHHQSPSSAAKPPTMGETTVTRSTRRNKTHSSKYKVRKHGLPVGGAVPWEGSEGEVHRPAESGVEDGESRPHSSRTSRLDRGGGNGGDAAGRKHPSKTIIGKLGMTAAGAAGRTALMEQKRKLYKDTTQQPLWGIRKLTINPIDKDDLRRFPGNALKTTKYTLLSFVPKALWKQFHRLPNWWLVAVLVLQYIPLPRFHEMCPSSTLLPLVFTLGVCLAKELLLDLQRRATDRWCNFRVCTIIDGRRPQLRMVHWASLRVGNIVRLTDEEEVPADVVVLATSNPEGIAYVETSKLDGETTLKFKQGVKETRTETYPLAIAGIRGRVVCEKPTCSMDHFSGSLKLDAHPRATPLDLSNFIHRGSHIRNTEWVYGVVVYTGHDTRSLRSAKHPKLKFAHIESEVNSYTLFSLFIVAVLILISVMSKSSVQDRERVNNVRTEFPSSMSFMLGTTDALQNPWLAILRYMTLFLAVIPVSLPFVLDCAYCIQAWLIQGDGAMTVGAPQQPLGSSFHFGFGLAPVPGQALSSPRSGVLLESANSHTPDNVMASKESLGAEMSKEARRSDPVSVEGMRVGARNYIKRTEGGTVEDATQMQASPTMRSFAEAKGDSTWPSVHTPSIIPDLGQVDFVFIDKTGTLTGNDMTFSMCSVVGRIYGMADFHGASWQSDECRTRSDLLDAAMIEQLRAARVDSGLSTAGQRQSTPGLWTPSNPQHGREDRGSAEATVAGGGFKATFLTTSTHGMPTEGGNGYFGPSPSSSSSPRSPYTPSPFSPHGSDAGLQTPTRSDSGPLNCIRYLEDNSPRPRRRIRLERAVGSGSFCPSSESPANKIPSPPAQSDDNAQSVPQKAAKNIAFGEDEIIDSMRGEIEQEGTASSSERSYLQSPSEGSTTRGAHALPGDGNHDDSLEGATKKDEKLRVPFLYDDITPPTHFRVTPPDGQIRRNCDFYDMQIFEDLANYDERSHRVNEFLKCMALCNTVVPHFKGNVVGVETFLPATLVQSWINSGTPHTTASMLARSMNTTAPLTMGSQRPNARSSGGSSATAARDAGAKTDEDRGPPAGGLWHYSSNTFAANPAAHTSHSIEANDVAEPESTPQPLLARGDSSDSGQPHEIPRKAAKMRKGLGRGVSFKDTHEEYNFPKDGEDMPEEAIKSFSTAEMGTKKSEDLSSVGRLPSPKLSSREDPGPRQPRCSVTSRVPTWDSARVLRSIKYQASSPDEECLVSAASHMGYSLTSRSPTSVVLQILICPHLLAYVRVVAQINDQLRRWQVIGVNEFTPKRGRMSVVLRPAGWSEGAVMYAKGADTAMLPLLSSFDGLLREHKATIKYEGGLDPSSDEASSGKHSPRTPRNDNARPVTTGPGIGAGGDREDALGPSDQDAYDPFYDTYHNPHKSSECIPAKPVRAPSGNPGEGDATFVEQHLKVFSLQGLRTMVLACKYMSQDETDTYQRLYNDAYASVYSREERLEQVAEQFERELEYLGITGVRDKLQAYVPETLELMMEAGIRIWIATGDDVEYTLHICHSCQLLTSHTKVFHAALATRGKRAKREGMLLYDMFREARILKRADEHICLVVTGPNLAAFLNHPDLQVRLVKKRLTPQPITLAIGDGVNDVPMLQEASVGVAIRTERGTSVAGFADFAISEFRFLQRLLFVHGRLNFMRISKVILWTFFKSILLAFPVFLFQPSAFWSAIELFDPLLYMLANFLWTTLPVIVYSFSEQDLPEHLLPSIPVLYTLGRRRLYFNGFTFSFWVVEGILYALVTYYLLQAAWMDSSALAGGPNMGFYAFGSILLFGLVIQSNLRILMETHLWTPTFVFTTLGLCTLLYIPVLYTYSAIGWPARGMFGIAPSIFSWPLLYFVVLLWVGVGLMLQVVLAGLKASFFPNIATNVKQWLAHRQAEHDRRRRATALPVGEPRLRLLPGGQDEYGPYCGTGSFLSAIKRLLWICGLGTCLPAPGPIHQLVDRRILAFLRDKFNPLRHSDVSSKLPPPRRFRVNENFVTYGSDKKEQDLGPLEKDGAGAQARAGGGAGDVSMDSNSSGMSFDGDKARDEIKLVKVSYLINRFSLKFKDMQLEADYQIHQKKSFVKRLVPWYRVIFVFLGLYRIVTFLSEYFIDMYWGTEKHVYCTSRAPSLRKELTIAGILASVLGPVNPRMNEIASCFFSATMELELFWMCIPSVIVVLGLLCATLSTFSHFFMDQFSVVLSCVVFLLLAEHVTFYTAARMSGILSSVLFPVFTFVILRISFLQAVVWNIIFAAAFIIRYIVGETYHYLQLSDLYDYLPLFLGSIVFVGFVGYRMEYNQRKSFLLDYSVEASRRKQREILNTMLPPFVVDQMINAPLNEDGIPSTLEAEDRGTVSVVFCDVYEFQQVVASIEPTRLVEVLDSLFLCFDKSAEQFGCTKIETVFETYLAAAGLQPGKGGESDTSQTDAGDAMDMALAMLEVAAQIRYEVTRDLTSSVVSAEDEQLSPAARLSSSSIMRQKTATLRQVLSSRPQRIRVKIGINSGRVISGVVGAKKPQYALFGDTVNTASRMKTTGQPDYIHISESTYELVKDDTTLIYEPRKTEVKGKGEMNTYLLVRVLGASYPNFGEEERSLSGPLSSKDGPSVQAFTHGSSAIGIDRSAWTVNPDGGEPAVEHMLRNAASFSHVGQHSQEAPGLLLASTPSTPRLTPGATSRSSLSEALSPPGGSSPRTPSTYSLDRVPSRGQRSYSTLSSGEGGALSLTPQQLTRAYARQESVSRVLAFARDGLQTAVSESSELKRQEIARQVHAHILREQLHQGSSPMLSSQDDMSVGSNCFATSLSSLPQFRYAASHNADLRSSSGISRSATGTRQSPRATTRRAFSEIQGGSMQRTDDDVNEPRLTTQGSNAGRLAAKWRAANDVLNYIGTEAHAKFSLFLRAIGNGSKEEHIVEIGGDDDDNFEAREARIGVSRESLLLMKFKDKNLEARYRTHFYNNKSNINTIEQAIIIFLVAFAMQTVVRLCMPVQYSEIVDGVKYTVQVSGELYWGVRATYTCVAFFLWILFHYRNRDEVASRLEIRWMVFLLNVLFISAACVFALSNSWSINQTTRHPVGGTATSSMNSASVLSPGVAIQTSTLGTEMLTYVRGGKTVRMPENVDLQSPVAFLSNKSFFSDLDIGNSCPYEGCLGSDPSSPTTEDRTLHSRRLQAESGRAQFFFSTRQTVEVPGQLGAAFWLVADSVELFFYLVILHHNTGLLFQNCILVDILLLTTCLTFILTAAVSTANTIGMVVNFPCYVFFNLVSAYWKEYIDRLTFYVNEHAKTTEGRATQLLNDMLPKQVLEEFQQDRLRLAYTHDRMTFLFADICGFTSWAKNVDACEVVTMLQKLFAKFDRDSTTYKLYKLCTIGDAYVAVSEPVTEDNEDYDPVEGTSLVLTMAQSMITNIQDVRERLKIPSLNMRIGLHYGTCVGGVIGSGRLRYDLWGMDVLTGNMMESNGQPGKVNVSEVLRDFLLKHFPGKFEFRFNKTVCVINKTVDSYIIHPAGEAHDEEPAPQPVGDAPLQGAAPSAPRRDNSYKQDIRGRLSRKGSLMGMQRSMARRQSLLNNVEATISAETAAFNALNISRPASRASSHRSFVPVGDKADAGLNRPRQEIEMTGGLPAENASQQIEMHGFKGSNSLGPTNTVVMHPISEEGVVPSASPRNNSDSSPDIF